MVNSLRGLPYPDRLRALRLPSLYYRRRRGDLIKVFQLLRGYVDVDPAQFFDVVDRSRTRGHQWKLAKPDAVSRVRHKSFAIRVVNDWNALPASVVEACTVDQFKRRLDSHWSDLMYCVPECPE